MNTNASTSKATSRRVSASEESGSGQVRPVKGPEQPSQPSSNYKGNPPDYSAPRVTRPSGFGGLSSAQQRENQESCNPFAPAGERSLSSLAPSRSGTATNQVLAKSRKNDDVAAQSRPLATGDQKRDGASKFALDLSYETESYIMETQFSIKKKNKTT